MACKYKGVYSRIIQKNNLAYFVPCSAHLLNLVEAHSEDAYLDAVSYFGTLHSVYNYFHGSTSGWEVLKKYEPLNFKTESQTR